MKVTIKLDGMLADQVKKSANTAHTSVEEYITNLLQDTLKTGNFEQRQFVGKRVDGKNVNGNNHLVMMDGIYYRYDLINEKELNQNASYEVIGNNGNILYLKKVKEEGI
ncbi:toxin-antitoxin system HicB family antitoxin [Apilactobacillus apisilvae]|uniref:Toxin-antitoxin system HicB family antitoxin n=1 Tax=Apilactobacillus apisilvae TaxID=2923364 RepID=A0ABY4PGZ1_9LACO|nr:toxin-antitoxin system HicB family antitoxin [Apilactobacillus apisilvae]UQS84923.1 toxin-antitoxin system HicB family antitoxin [Apilactobacillus apisilvae]